MEKKNKTTPIQIVFLRWSSKNEKDEKKGFSAKIAWHYSCRQGRKTRIFVHTICFGQISLFGQNSENQETP